MVFGMPSAPEQAVAAADIDPPNQMPRLIERMSQAQVKRRSMTLKK
jgi:hypothetical protein